jgi:hypothetical protein
VGWPGGRGPPTHGRPGVEQRAVGPRLGRRSRAGAERARPEPGATGPEPREGGVDGARRGAEHAAQEHGEGGQYGAQAGGQVGKPLLYQ